MSAHVLAMDVSYATSVILTMIILLCLRLRLVIFRSEIYTLSVKSKWGDLRDSYVGDNGENKTARTQNTTGYTVSTGY